MPSTSANVLVVGATGGSGRAVVQRLLREGHAVTAFSRSADQLLPGQTDPLLTRVCGDATNLADVDAVIPGHDAVIVALGISESPIGVRLRGSRGTPLDVRSAGTRNVITAMRRHGVRRLVVQSSFGVGPTRKRLGWIDRLFFRLLLQPQIDDTELQEQEVRTSGIDWVIAQPVHLTDGADSEPPFLSKEGIVRRMKVAREQVASFLVEAVRTPRYVGCSVAVSG